MREVEIQLALFMQHMSDLEELRMLHSSCGLPPQNHAIRESKEEIELPLKLMVLGDLTQCTDERKGEDRKPISIDKNSFDEGHIGIWSDEIF